MNCDVDGETEGDGTERLPRLSVADGIGYIRLDDPTSYNSLSPAAFIRLREIFAEIDERAHKDVSVLVLTGTGKAFCAGAELSSMLAMGEAGAAEGEESIGQRLARWTRDECTPTVMEWNKPPVPMVCAVNGVAAGIGMSLALSADIVVAARSASFMVPFMTGLGIVPDGGLTWQLPRLIGHARSMAMTLLGERISAEQAESWGLIWRCVDDDALQETAVTIARRLAKLPQYAAEETRNVFRLSWDNDFKAQYDLELQRNTELLDRPEFLQNLMAFLGNKKSRPS